MKIVFRHCRLEEFLSTVISVMPIYPYVSKTPYRKVAYLNKIKVLELWVCKELAYMNNVHHGIITRGVYISELSSNGVQSVHTIAQSHTYLRTYDVMGSHSETIRYGRTSENMRQKIT